MTAFHSTQLGSSPAAHNNCNHPRLSIGLDSAYCPNCKANFGSRSQEYQNALRPPSPVIPATEYKVGDRVSILREPPQAIYQIVKLAAGHATVESLVKGPGCDRRRIALWKLRPSCALANRDDQALELPNQNENHDEQPPECFNAKPLDDTERPPELLTGSPHSTVLEDESSNERPPELLPAASRDSRHTPASGWIEKYLAKRRWEYYRYCWQAGHKGKISKLHIPANSGKLAVVREAIAAGQSPSEIIQLIKSWRKQS